MEIYVKNEKIRGTSSPSVECTDCVGWCGMMRNKMDICILYKSMGLFRTHKFWMNFRDYGVSKVEMVFHSLSSVGTITVNCQTFPKEISSWLLIAHPNENVKIQVKGNRLGLIYISNLSGAFITRISVGSVNFIV